MSAARERLQAAARTTRMAHFTSSGYFTLGGIRVGGPLPYGLRRHFSLTELCGLPGPGIMAGLPWRAARDYGTQRTLFELWEQWRAQPRPVRWATPRVISSERRFTIIDEVHDGRRNEGWEL